MPELTTQQPFPGPVLPPADVAPATPAAPAAQLRGPVSPTAVALALVSLAVTLTMLAPARHWSDHGARHSIGDMVPLTLGAIIGLALTAWPSPPGPRPPKTRCWSAAAGPSPPPRSRSA